MENHIKVAIMREGEREGGGKRARERETMDFGKKKQRKNVRRAIIDEKEI